MLGYAFEKERKEEIQRNAARQTLLDGLYSVKEIDVRPWRPGGWWSTRNQSQVGSCRGHSLAGAGRYTARLAAGTNLDLDKDGTPNEPLEDDFSPRWCYEVCKRHDKLAGDNGATIASGIKTGTINGLAREIVVPYINSYNQEFKNLTPEMSKDAAAFKFKKYFTVEGSEQDAEERIFDHIASGQGPFDWGKLWPLPFEGGCVVRRADSSTFRRGGHATVGVGLILGSTLLQDLPKLDKIISPNEFLYVVANSHGTRAQHAGFFYVTREGMRATIRQRYTNIMLWTDLTTPTPRSVDWANTNLFG